MLPKFAYIRPESMTEALEQLASDDARVFAGGTDLLGCLRDGVFDAPKVVSLSGLDEMHGIEETAEGGLRIGALTTLAEIASSDVIRSRCYAVEGENQYHAILGGAPCFIVHPSDTAPALVALGASVRLARGGTERTVPLEEFFVLPEVDVGNENILEPGEIITEVIIPSPQPGTVSTYRKVRERGAWDFALTSLALVLKKEGERAAEVSAVFGGVAPVPWRSRPMQEAIAGERLSPDVAADAANAAVRDADPLEKNGYKVDLVKGVVEETLLSLA
jgi:xanthine dehydrogenase YagS FAD-binding subunit